jgi:hypothetical protein
MKKLLLLAVIVLLPYLASAQTVITEPLQTTISPPIEEYCIVNIHQGIFERTYCVDIDRGQNPDMDRRLRDSDRKEIRFNSLADALNYMAKNGWLYVNTIKMANRDEPDYLMRRVITANNNKSVK